MPILISAAVIYFVCVEKGCLVEGREENARILNAHL
jgi:hypothetical protein